MLILMVISGCKNNGNVGLLGNPGSSGGVENKDVLVISPAYASIITGSSQSYNAYVFQDGKFVEEVTDKATWLASDGDNVTFNKPGVASSSYEGEVNISATYDGMASNSATLMIEDRTISSITVVPKERTTVVGVNVSFQAIATFEDGGYQDVTDVSEWTVDDQAIAEVASSGVLSPLTRGDTRVTASYQGESDDGEIHVVGNIDQVKSFDITPKNSLILLGDKVQLTATLTLINGDKIDVTDLTDWDTSLSGTQISAHGVFGSQVVGESDITATLGDFSDDAKITIQIKGEPTLVVSPDNATLPVYTHGSYLAQLTYPTGETFDVTDMSLWSSSNTDVIAISAFGPLGGSAFALSKGDSVITASFGTYMESVTTTITDDIEFTSIELTPSEQTIPVGSVASFKALAHSNVHGQDVLIDVTDSVASTLSDDSIAESTAQPLTFIGDAEGTAILSVSMDGMTAEATLNVVAAQSVSKYIVQVVDEEITDESDPLYWQDIPVGLKLYANMIAKYEAYNVQVYTYQIALGANGELLDRTPVECTTDILWDEPLFFNSVEDIGEAPTSQDVFSLSDQSTSEQTGTQYSFTLLANGPSVETTDGQLLPFFRVKGETRCGEGANSQKILWLTDEFWTNPNPY